MGSKTMHRKATTIVTADNSDPGRNINVAASKTVSNRPKRGALVKLQNMSAYCKDQNIFFSEQERVEYSITLAKHQHK